MFTSHFSPESSTNPQSLARFGTIYTPKSVFPARDVPFGGLDNIGLNLGVKLPKNLPKIGVNRHFAAKSAK